MVAHPQLPRGGPGTDRTLGPVVGIDVGIANFLTASSGQHYGTFHGKLGDRQKRDREKRRRKAKLRKCLEMKGVKKLPSTSSKSGKRLARLVRQEINRAVNECFARHEGAQFAYEHLSVATMKHKARTMNAYMRASNLAHIPEQIAWSAAKRGIRATRVKSAYTSQECSVCHYVDRANRPDQQTFCCVVCGYSTHADLNAATNIEHRWGDSELQARKGRQAHGMPLPCLTLTRLASDHGDAEAIVCPGILVHPSANGYISRRLQSASGRICLLCQIL